MRYYYASGTNCLQCCIASLLDMPLDEVVDVSKVEKYWPITLQEWMNEHNLKFMFAYGIPKDIPYIGVVEWQVGGCHAVIFKNGIQIFNPNPAHTEVFHTTIYNIIITKEDFNGTIIANNGETLRAFVDNNNIA